MHINKQISFGFYIQTFNMLIIGVKVVIEFILFDLTIQMISIEGS